VGAALVLVRLLGTNPSGAGLLPIAVGYLIAHYLTYLLISGQLIVVAVSDPFQRGWNIFGTLFYEPSSTWLPPGLVWTLQLAAVVGGHMVGAWAGHAAAVADTPPGTPIRKVRLRQLPLAIVMVALTTLTLWSLGRISSSRRTDHPTARLAAWQNSGVQSTNSGPTPRPSIAGLIIWPSPRLEIGRSLIGARNPPLIILG
jgi:hypothetical protein